MIIDAHTQVAGSVDSRKPLAVFEYLSQLVNAEIEVALHDGNRRQTVVPVVNERRVAIAA